MINQPLKHGPYSPSRLDCALCPYHFARKYIRKDAPKENSEAASKGSAVHHAFEMIANAVIAGKEIPSIDECFTSATTAHTMIHYSSKMFVRDAITLFRDNPTRMFTPSQVVGVEELLAVDSNYDPVDYDSPLAMLRGKADILSITGDIATIIDHKNQLNVETADTFQMGVYALLVLKTYPYLNHVNSILHFSAPTLNFYSEPALWSRAHLGTFLEHVESRIMLAEATDVDNLTTVPGKYCQYCAMLTDCPQRAKIEEGILKTVGPIDSPDTALEYAKAYVYLDECMGAIKSPLRDYVENHAPIKVGNAIVEIRESGGRAYDKKEAVLAAFAAHKVPSDMYLRVDSTMLRKLMDCPDTNPALVAALEKVTYKKPTLSMGAYKAK